MNVLTQTNSYKRSDKYKVINSGQLIDKLPLCNAQTSIEWNAEEFPSGIYLFKLNRSNSPVKKMILLK